MTTQKLFKRRVRERMAKTGERYTAARRHLATTRDDRSGLDAGAASRSGPDAGTTPAPAAPPVDLSGALEVASDEKMIAATGEGWLHWIAVLDAWGTAGRPRGEITAWLSSEHGVPPWYRQAVVTGYERVRGIRAKHQQPDGYTVYGSKTVGVPLEILFDAFIDARLRARWLTDGSMRSRSANPGKVARFAWDGGDSRVEVTFEAKGEGRATAHVAHSRLPDPKAAEAEKAAWKARLASLKSTLEAARG